MARLSNEEDPRPASRFDRSLRGDLDTILGTAIARDPERRHATVDALASDVRRVLMGEPIQARPATAWYQMRKFTQRHRCLVVGAAGTLLALVLAVIGTSVGFLRAANERDRTVLAMKQAEEERDHAREINALITGIFASADPDVVGHSVLVVDPLDGAGRRLKAATDLSPLARSGLNMTLGTTLAAIADQVTILADLGDFDAARALLSEFRITAKAVSNPPAWLIM